MCLRGSPKPSNLIWISIIYTHWLEMICMDQWVGNWLEIGIKLKPHICHTMFTAVFMVMYSIFSSYRMCASFIPLCLDWGSNTSVILYIYTLLCSCQWVLRALIYFSVCILDLRVLNEGTYIRCKSIFHKVLIIF